MAMTKCKECKKEVSTKAKTCPHCGVKDPGTKFSEVLGGFVILLVVIFAIVKCSEDDPGSQAGKEPQKTGEQLELEAAACKTDLQCWAEKHHASASVYCVNYVEKMAKYSFEWTDGMFESKFSHFRWKNINQGVTTYIGDKIKFQNGFGAWQNMTYECDFDPVNNQILDIRVRGGLL